MSDTLTQRILDAVAADRAAMLDLTRSLVAIPTPNPPGSSYRECVEAIATALRALGFDCSMLVNPGSAPYQAGGAPPASDESPRYFLQSFYGQGTRTLYFHGHYDVVPAMSAAQFQPFVRDSTLVGRGAADMKSGLVAMIYAMKAVRDCGIALGGRIGLTIVPDEETGGARGARYLAQAGVLGRDGIGMLTAEPTGGVIWNASRGALTLRVTVHGKPAHVGMQHEGINAFERMLVVARALLDLKAEVEQRTTRFALDPEPARHSILMLGGECSGGANFNVVPAHCTFSVERRINPEEDVQTETERLLGLLERLRRDGIDLDVEIVQQGEAAATPPDDALAGALAAGVAAVTGSQPAFEMCPGLLEIRFYARQGIPALAYGPGLLAVAHGPDEYVEVEDICRCAAVYALTAVHLLTA